MEIKDREKLVLNAVIDHYIRTGDTISSITLVKKYNVKFSSATIRNVMVALEDLGYLDKTHASSGRIPTSKGYKYYIDSLITLKAPTAFEKAAVNRAYLSPVEELRQLYSETVELLSNLTQTATFLISFDEEKPLKKVEFLYINSRKIILVLVFEGDALKYEEIRFKTEITQALIIPLIEDVNVLIEKEEIKKAKEVLTYLSTYCQFNVGYYSERFKHRFNAEYVFYGIQNLIYSIEDLTSTDTLELLNLLNNPIASTRFFSDLFETHNDHVVSEDGVKIILGEELGNELFNKFGIVLKEVNTEGKRIILGIVGPRRMQYEKIVSLIEYVGNKMRKQAINI